MVATALIKKPNYQSGKTSARVIQVFLNVDLRSGHAGLSQIAQKKKLKLKVLEDGQFVIFINRRQTGMKCYLSGNTVTYTKRDRISLETIRFLPECFGGDADLAYDAALEKALKSKLKSEQH